MSVPSISRPSDVVPDHPHSTQDLPIGRGVNKVVGTNDLADTDVGESGASMVGVDISTMPSYITGDTLQQILEEIAGEAVGDLPESWFLVDTTGNTPNSYLDIADAVAAAEANADVDSPVFILVFGGGGALNWDGTGLTKDSTFTMLNGDNAVGSSTTLDLSAVPEGVTTSFVGLRITSSGGSLTIGEDATVLMRQCVVEAEFLFDQSGAISPSLSLIDCTSNDPSSPGFLPKFGSSGAGTGADLLIQNCSFSMAATASDTWMAISNVNVTIRDSVLAYTLGAGDACLLFSCGPDGVNAIVLQDVVFNIDRDDAVAFVTNAPGIPIVAFAGVEINFTGSTPAVGNFTFGNLITANNNVVSVAMDNPSAPTGTIPDGTLLRMTEQSSQPPNGFEDVWARWDDTAGCWVQGGNLVLLDASTTNGSPSATATFQGSGGNDTFVMGNDEAMRLGIQVAGFSTSGNYYTGDVVAMVTRDTGAASVFVETQTVTNLSSNFGPVPSVSVVADLLGGGWQVAVDQGTEAGNVSWKLGCRYTRVKLP